MATTQSEDPNEKVDHPRHYNQHPSGIECIELIEHLPANLANAVKYIWRCGLKQSETPLRDLKSALWYVRREQRRIAMYELNGEPGSKTDVVWRALAHQVVTSEWSKVPDSVLCLCLIAILDKRLYDIEPVLVKAIYKLEGASS